jgi:hypothetical protein
MSGSLDFVMSKMSDFQGHTNEKVKMVATQLFNDLPNYNMTNKNICIKSLVNIEGKKAPSPKILCGRLETLSTIIEEYKCAICSQIC